VVRARRGMYGIAGTVRHDSEMPFPKPTALVPDGRVKRSTRHRGVAYVGMSRARKLQPNHLTLPSHCRLGIRSHVAGSLISTTSSNSIVTTAIAVRIRFERFQRASKRRRQEHYEGKELHNASAYQAERRWTSLPTPPASPTSKPTGTEAWPTWGMSRARTRARACM